MIKLEAMLLTIAAHRDGHPEVYAGIAIALPARSGTGKQIHPQKAPIARISISKGNILAHSPTA